MKYLGIDFGLKRIGLSISEGNLASLFKVIEVDNLKDSVEKISQIILSEGFEKIVIGMPEGKTGKAVLGFVNKLKKRGFDVDISDETLSSKKAQDQMIGNNIPKKKRRFNDSYAAAIILQDYLDNR